MFFPEKITLIKKGDRVLEVGPGGTPHPRSDIFLEMKFDDPNEEKFQRGNTEPLETDKKIIYYDGEKFPFKDNEFDYIICSHVLEHVENIPVFISELSRVARAGYIEFPTICYEYLYNFDPHLNFILFKDDTIYWLSKKETAIDDFKEVNNFFFDTLNKSYSDIVDDLKEYMFQGFEWKKNIKQIKELNIEKLVPAYNIRKNDITKKQLSLKLKNLQLKQNNQEKTILYKIKTILDGLF